MVPTTQVTNKAQFPLGMTANPTDFVVDMAASTEERIKSFLAYSLALGQVPTTRQVTSNARVSASTLKDTLPRLIEEVREEQRALEAIPAVPADIAAGFEKFWQSAWKHADATFDAKREELAREVRAAQEEAEGNFEALCDMEAERDNALTATAEVTADLAALRVEHDALRVERDDLAGKFAELQSQLAIAQARLEERDGFLQAQRPKSQKAPKAKAPAVEVIDDVDDNTLPLPFDMPDAGMEVRPA